MELDIRLEDEILFGKSSGKIKIHYLKERGISTVKELLCCDIDNMCADDKAREYYRGMKDILSNKYLNTPLVREALLDEEISITDEIHDTVEDIKKNYLNKLCIKTPIGGAVRDLFLIDSVEKIKVIDFIKYLAKIKTGDELFILRHYIKYYNSQSGIEKNESLDSLNRKLLMLTGQKESLDEKIQLLNEQKKELVEGMSNGRK